MNVSAPFVVRPIATTLLTIGLILLGVVAYILVPIAGVPQVDIPTIRVTANLPGANAETMATPDLGRYRDKLLGNPVQRGHRFRRKADSNPVIAGSR